jgi:uncharacterized membrane protein YgcG
MVEPQSDSERQPSDTDDDTTRHAGPEPKRGILSRPGVWLGTLSTVVAIATGMFSLRDQIFPSDAGTASASSGVYQTSVGQICMALNQANGALGPNAANLARRLAKAETPLAQRNAVLDSWNVVLNGSQYELGLFEGLDVPGGLVAREHVTAAAWTRMVARLRGFTRRLDAVSDDAALMAAVLTLPAMGQANAVDLVTRTAGLTDLGGGRCELASPAYVPTITLPLLPGASTVAVSVTAGTAAAATATAAGGKAPKQGNGLRLHPKKVARGSLPTPSVTPSLPFTEPPPVTPTRPALLRPEATHVTPAVEPPATSSAGGGSGGSGGAVRRGGGSSGGGALGSG